MGSVLLRVYNVRAKADGDKTLLRPADAFVVAWCIFNYPKRIKIIETSIEKHGTALGVGEVPNLTRPVFHISSEIRRGI